MSSNTGHMYDITVGTSSSRPGPPGDGCELAAATRTGRRSAANEDALLALADVGLIILADGRAIGPASNIAAQVAIDAVEETLSRHRPPSNPQAAAAEIREAFCAAGRKVASLQSTGSALRPVSTSLLVARLTGRRLVLAHVGDVRAYRMRAGVLSRRTTDHILLEQNRRHLTADEVEALTPLQLVLTRSVGHPGGEPDVRVDELAVGDRYIFCTNGLWEVVSAGEIAAAICEIQDLPALCESLVSLAAARGEDDVTVIAMRFAADALHGPNGRPETTDPT